MARAIFLSIPLFLVACRTDQGLKTFNAEPDAEITSHSDGDEVYEGYTESFRGAVSDPDHAAEDLTATWYLDGEVVCESAAPDSDGISTCDVVITPTAAEITLEVQDPDNAAGSDQVLLSAIPTESPEAEITAPTEDGIYYSDQKITFEGVVSDGEDVATDLVVAWESDLDGDLEIESTPNDDGEVLGYGYLTEGEHAVELDVTDTTGKTGTASVIVDVGPPNSAPTCSITAPGDGSAGEESALVTFLATVADVDVAPDWLSASWASDKDGELGTSSPTSAGEVTFPYADLSVNTHVITLSVADEVGATCTSDIIYSVGTAPSISIASPTSGDVVDEGDLVSFVATVSDGEDSATDLTLSWVSDQDGEFSTQGSDSTGAVLFNESGLSTGTHSITATVTDTDGLYASAILTLQVNGLPTAPEVELTPDPADTSDDLVVTITSDSTDPEGDAISYSYAWSVDGVPSSASTTSTLDASETAKGQTWAVTVTPNDGYSDGPSGSDDLTIGNTAPEITSVVIDPDPAAPDDELSCSWSFYDEDGDDDESTLEWTIDGVSVGTETTLSGVFLANDEVTCTVTAHDGDEAGTSDSASITITNTAPEVTEVTLSPSTVYTNDTLTASVSTDDTEGDSVSVAYAWYVDGSLVGETGTSLDGTTYFDKDHEVYVVVTPSDDYGDGAPVTSDSIIVSNTPPEAPEISISEGSAQMQVSAGGWHTCALESSGTVVCWGLDGSGQVSDTPTGSDYVSVEAGARHSCALDSSGSIECWGVDTNNEVSDTPSSSGFTAIDVGNSGTCALDASGGIECWGWDSFGEISGTPTGTGYTAVEGGGYHHCALDSTGTIECWGRDNYGQVSDTPTGSGYTLITAHAYHTCALDSAGSIECWGWDTYGQVSDVPTGSGYTDLDGSSYSTCAIDSTSAIECWGSDMWLAISDAPTGTGYVQVSGMNSHVCAVDSAGEVECWGENGSDQCEVPELEGGVSGLLCSIDTESTDDDGDAITYTFEWEVDGTSYTDATTTVETGDTVPSSDYSGGETWTCIVTPSDGDDDGDSATASYTLELCTEDSGEDEDCPGLDCLQILEDGHSVGDGDYWIDPDGTGALEVYCDMSTDDGGWTRIFVADSTNYSDSSGLDYTITNETLREDAHKTMMVFVDSGDAVVSSYATFDIPSNWVSQSPMQYSSETEFVEVSVDGIDEGTEELVYGIGNWGSYSCDDDWISGVSGQVCITGTAAPFYTRFADSHTDRCNASDEDERTNDCSTDTRFSILVRRPIDADGDGSAADEDCDDDDPTVTVYGSGEACPALDCLDILDEGYDDGDGNYWIDPTGTSTYQVYCDMSTDGGGWTLVAQGGALVCGTMGSSSDMTDADSCSFLSFSEVSSLAGGADEVMLQVGGNSTSFGDWTGCYSGSCTTVSQDALAVDALTSATGTWHNGATWDDWDWTYSCTPSWATGWPNMYHACGNGDGVHWIGDTVSYYAHNSDGSSLTINLISATWLR